MRQKKGKELDRKDYNIYYRLQCLKAEKRSEMDINLLVLSMNAFYISANVLLNSKSVFTS